MKIRFPLDLDRLVIHVYTSLSAERISSLPSVSSNPKFVNDVAS